MNEVSLLQSLGQVSASQTAEIFRDFLRGHVREMICEVMAAEVTGLCVSARQRQGAYDSDGNATGGRRPLLIVSYR